MWRGITDAEGVSLDDIGAMAATPFLSAVVPPVYASAVGNTVLGLGFLSLGWELTRRRNVVSAPPAPAVR